MNIELQTLSKMEFLKKYALRDNDGNYLEQEPAETFARVAKALAAVEAPKARKKWQAKFLDALKHGAIPAGRILANAGADNKKGTSTINCTVSGVIHDSMDGILNMVREAGLTLKAGCGIGYSFSTLRPKGASVYGVGAETSGPLSFMDVFDSMCETISSAGSRRGAQMATMLVSHPDIIDFIHAKREKGRLRRFNLSVLITKAFVDAVKNDEDWQLYFPALPHDDENCEFIYREWEVTDGYEVNDQGLVKCKVYDTVPARGLWDMIMKSTYDYAEPGFILIDEVNDKNNNWWCENIMATNPCGEVPLPPYGSCLLGSLNLTAFVNKPFTKEAYFDFDKFKEVVAVFTRMLDNVVEINGLPLERQRHEITYKRRHGMGYTGLGSALAMLGVAYGSDDAADFAENVAKHLAIQGFITGLELAKEKGAAPIMEDTFEVTPAMLRKRPEMVKDGYSVGDKVQGKVLWAKYSRYLQSLFDAMGEQGQQLKEDLMKNGCRFTHHTSIAPTGTISLTVGNNVSNGIEPTFSHVYKRNVIEAGRKTKVSYTVRSFEYLAYRALIDDGAEVDTLPDSFVVADSITPKEHVKMQAVTQKWIDASISKTVNVPTDIHFDDFKDVYMDACDSGLKGCTTFRFNPDVFQGVLVREEDLANTIYCFTLEDGSEVKLKGDEMVEYNGEVVTAANLYDSLKS